MFELYIAIISLLIAALSLLYTIEDKKIYISPPLPSNGRPSRIRTGDAWLIRPTLSPTELRDNGAAARTRTANLTLTKRQPYH